MTHSSGSARALLAAIVLSGAAFVTGCSDPDEATMCYPAFPTVTPAAAAAGATVIVGSDGIGNCPYPNRRQSYELRLQTTPLGVNRHGPRLGVLKLDPTTGAFAGAVTLPVGTAPGSYYVTWGRAPTDHYDWPIGCNDTNASCGGPSPNLIVLP